MAETFMSEDFLLQTKTARILFTVRSSMPIFDYHCHIAPREISEDKQFQIHPDMALRRPLQMAGNASQRNRREILHRRGNRF